MLHIPEGSPDYFVIAGTDPGTRFLGLGILHVDIKTLLITESNAYTVVIEKMISEKDTRAQMHGAKYARLMALQEDLVGRFHHHRPAYLASEGAYFNPGRPGAYGPLIETIMTVRMAAEEYDPLMPVVTYAPSEIKTAVGAKGGANKVPVLAGVQQLPINYRGATPLDQLSDHAVDGLAIAYTHYLNLLKDLSWTRLAR